MQPMGQDASLKISPLSLCFASEDVEGEYLGEVAKRRWPVLIFIFCFDIATFTFRMGAKFVGLVAEGSSGGLVPSASLVVREMGHQLANMAMLYVLLGLLNKRARHSGSNAARQEEVLLSVCMALAICNLLASLNADNAQDYVYLAYFLICTSTFLKIRWWVGTGLLAAPAVAMQAWRGGRGLAILPPDALVHIAVAWAVGGFMAYLAETYRREMFASQKRAEVAHCHELREAQARIQAQRELAAAQAQGAQRALSVAREKAANEAKSEFMSLMCHEVRTPLNGCLASAEMLLDTPLAEEQRELAKTIRVSGSILLSTVSNFLDYFKMEAGKRLDIVRTEVAMDQLVADVHCIIEAMIGWDSPVKLRQPCLEGVPPVVLADPDRLRGIVLNLYTNAAKFTKRGHIGLRVRAVSEGYVPEPPLGWAGITLRPSYEPHKSQSSRTSEDSRPTTPDGPGTPSGGASPRAASDLAAVAAAPAPAAGALTAAASDREGDGKGGGARDRGGTDGSGAAAAWGALPVEGARRLMALITADARSANGTLPSPLASAPPAASAPAADNPPAAVYAPPADGNGNGVGGGAQVPLPQQQQDQQGLWLLFEVQDSGVGIGSEGLASLFKEYVQGTDDEMAKPRAKGGTGLGLSICSKQVGVLGGYIGAHSAPGRGSTFWFAIPAVLPAPSRRSSGSAVSTPPVADARSGGAGGVQAVASSHLARADSGGGEGGGGGAGAGGAASSAPAPSRPAVTFVPAASRRAVPLHLQSGIYSTGNNRFSMEQAAAAAEAAHEAAEAAEAEAEAVAAAAGGGAGGGAPRLPHPAPLPPGRSAALPPPRPPPLVAPSALPDGARLSLDGRMRAPLDVSRLSGRRVLLAEDNLINQTVARKMLASLGCEVEVAANGLEALRAVERSTGGVASTLDGYTSDGSSSGSSSARVSSESALLAGAGGGGGAGAGPPPVPFSVILMDMGMPVMGGVEATRRIREAGIALPVLAMTANASDRDRQECLQAGMDGFLSKPVLKDQLAAAMLRVMRE